MPALAINFGLGNIPLRYITFIFIFRIIKVDQKDVLLLIVPFLCVLFMLLSAPFRPFHLLDISYILGFIYLLLGVSIVRGAPDVFRKYIFYFWVVNIVYAVIQNMLIIVLGDSSFALLHQNVHDPSYSIPPVSYLPLFRVTGLFVESAPFVIYLMFTHIAFVSMGFKKIWVRINLFCIFLAGAKVGLIFLLLLLLVKLPIFKKIRLLYLLIIMLGLTLMSASLVATFIESYTDMSLGSMLVRFNGLISTIDHFGSSWQNLLMGYGYVSSAEIMSGKELEFERGIDFFSTFIIANGLIGTVMLVIPVVVWIKRNAVFEEESKNILSASFFIALLTMGSLLNFQYAYIMFIIALSSIETVNNEDAK